MFEQLQLAPPQGIEPSELGTLTGSAAFRFQAEPRAIDIGELQSALLRQGVYLNNSERKPCQTEARHLSAPIT